VSSNDRAFDFLQGGGAVGALMRTHDWSPSPLGAPETWPQPLRSVVGLVLQSRFPMFVAWGDGLGFLYNDAYAEILGAKHPRALGQRFYDVWGELWPEISPFIDAALAGQAIYREDLPLVINRKGYDEQTWFTFSYSPLHDESGKVAGMFCAVSETTRRVLAERALRELNETLERRVNEALAERRVLADIVEGTDAFVQVADLDYRWLAINRAAADEFERLFGIRPQVGDNMLELLAAQPANQAAVKAPWRRALGGEEFVEIGEFGDPTRVRRVYEMRYSSLRDASGARIGAYQFVYDVTARVRDQERLKQAEEALRQSQKLEAMGRLTGGVAHDFNNLLAVFSNGLHVLERNVSAEQRERVCAAMRRALARGTGLTHQLLAFTRRQPIHADAIDLAAHLEGLREMLERSLPDSIRVEMDFAADVWPVEVDTGEFELAMLNLFANARDAMPDGGVITVQARNVTQAVDDRPEADFVRLCIADTGSGMPPEVLDHAFEPFFTTKDVGKGSGLGLPQAYGFAQQSGGRITIESRLHVGTIVTLLLPRSLQEPAAPVEAPDNAAVRSDPSGRQVLLVEDDVELAALTREMLGHLGDARNIDIVFSDIAMPGGMNGIELAREIRRRQPGLSIVLATGNADAAANMGNAEFRLLLKPYSLDALADALGLDAR
jgi:signal transduction histidine kinase/CheY-like chemotaxis protein